MLYLWMKYIHILSSTILFGTGLGTASVMLFGHLTKKPLVIGQINRYVVIADTIFTLPTSIIQPVSGFILMYLAGFPLSATWIWLSLLLYVIAGICWLIVVVLQIKLRDIALVSDRKKSPLPKKYYQYYHWWFLLGWPAFIGFMFIFYFMIFKPT